MHLHQELAQEKAKRQPPDPALLYARDDHLRAMEELEDARAQLTAAKAALSESEREMEAREEQLVVATDNLAAVQQDRTRLQQDLVALGAQLGDAETRLKDAQLEHHELALSSRAEIDQVTSSLHELHTRFQDEVGPFFCARQQQQRGGAVVHDKTRVHALVRTCTRTHVHTHACAHPHMQGTQADMQTRRRARARAHALVDCTEARRPGTRIAHADRRRRCTAFTQQTSWHAV